MSKTVAAPQRPSRRERNKEDKQQRIKKAAADLFAARGYAKTTMAQIADRADVSAGTLFFYARTKEALLCMVMIDDLRSAFERARRGIPARASLAEKMARIYGHTLRYHARNKELSVHFVREVGALRDSRVEMGVKRVVAQIVQDLIELVSLDQQAQLVRADVSAADLAACFAALHYQVLAQFLNDQLTLRQSLTALESRIKIAYEGMRASPQT